MDRDYGNMKEFKSFIQFLDFSLNFKFPKLVKKYSVEELLELYYKFAPLYWNTSTNLEEKVRGAIVIHTVGIELKQRFPKILKLQNWDFTSELNLHEIIKGGK